jgi:hypothetical protein
MLSTQASRSAAVLSIMESDTFTLGACLQDRAHGRRWARSQGFFEPEALQNEGNDRTWWKSTRGGD